MTPRCIRAATCPCLPWTASERAGLSPSRDRKGAGIQGVVSGKEKTRSQETEVRSQNEEEEILRSAPFDCAPDKQDDT